MTSDFNFVSDFVSLKKELKPYVLKSNFLLCRV